MLLNKEENKYSAIYISVDKKPELISSSLEYIFDYAEIKNATLLFAPLNKDLCMCADSSYFNTSYLEVNYFATEIYRDYLHNYSIKEVVYGPVLLFCYEENIIQNIEHLYSIKDVYVDEITNRYSYREKTTKHTI
jgi:hypothetical protein